MTRPALLGHPYRPPTVQAGCQLYDEYKGGDVTVAGFAGAPIGPWPCWEGVGGQTLPILTGDLTRAVRMESAQAVAYWWQVSRETVTRWRRALGVGRMTEGTLQLWSELAPQRLPQEARERGGQAARKRAKEKTK